jgi:hypothetical protein
MGRVALIPQPGGLFVQYVCRNLRDRDAEEIFATRFHDDPDQLASEIATVREYSWCAVVDHEPVAIIGAYEKWPGVWSVFAFGTDRWPEVVLTLTKHVRRVMIPELFERGAIRADCHALETHDDARRWLTALGAKEGPGLDNFGKNGQSFVCYCWTRETTKGLVHVR